MFEERNGSTVSIYTNTWGASVREETSARNEDCCLQCNVVKYFITLIYFGETRNIRRSEKLDRLESKMPPLNGRAEQAWGESWESELCNCPIPTLAFPRACVHHLLQPFSILCFAKVASGPKAHPCPPLSELLSCCAFRTNRTKIFA